MFYNCSSLTRLDLSNFNAPNVTSMDYMFSGCTALKSLNLSHFNAPIVKNLSRLFENLKFLEDLNLNYFNAPNAMSMANMFDGCSSLTSLDLSNFNANNVSDISYMFNYCRQLKSIDLRGFTNVVYAEKVFFKCSSLETIYSGNWSPQTSGSMFSGCSKLVGGRGTKIGQNHYGYDANGKPLYYTCPSNGSAAHIDGGKDNPGLFTAK